MAQDDVSALERSLDQTTGPSPIFEAYNRGIILASMYGSALLLVFEYLWSRGQSTTLGPLALVAYGLTGFLAGTIGGFSRSDDLAEDETRDLKRNAMDAGVLMIWIAIVVLAANLVVPFSKPASLLALLGACVLGGQIGALLGEPILSYLAQVPIKGRRPFLFVSNLTTSIENDDVRFVTRVIIQSILLAALLTLAFALFVVFLVIVALWLGFLAIGLIMTLMDGGEHVRIPKRVRVRGSGEITSGRGRKTGLKVRGDKKIVREGFFSDQETGLELEGEKVMKRGIFTDKKTGVEMRMGSGGRELYLDGEKVRSEEVEIDSSGDAHEVDEE